MNTTTYCKGGNRPRQGLLWIQMDPRNSVRGLNVQLYARRDAPLRVPIQLPHSSTYIIRTHLPTNNKTLKELKREIAGKTSWSSWLIFPLGWVLLSWRCVYMAHPYRFRRRRVVVFCKKGRQTIILCKGRETSINNPKQPSVVKIPLTDRTPQMLVIYIM